MFTKSIQSPKLRAVLRVSMILLLNFVLTAAAFAQVRISGKVVGKDNKPIAGASVTIKNTTFGTSTEANGSYTLNAELKAGTYTIEFSGVGFKAYSQSLQIGSGASYTVDAQLSADALNLDEVVVTGTSAGTTRRQLGNYISSVKADQLTKGASGNVLQALQGKTAGAQIIQNSGDPAGGISVRLRGISTIYSSSEPLYIVDGVIVSNATNRVTNTQSGYDGGRFVGTIGTNRLADINPADIERIEVLNGAAAAAIYGSRANAGVIQIFTKRGTSGTPTVNFSSSVMVNQLRKQVKINEAPTKFGGSPDVQTQDILTPALTNTTNVTRYNYWDYIFRTGIGTDNNISVSGGAAKTKYYLSGSYFSNQGIVEGTDFKRFSFRSNIEQTINNWLTASMGLNYVNSTSNEKPDGNSFFSPMNGVTILGNFHDIWTRDALGNIKAVGERGRVNPVSIIEDVKQRSSTNRVISSFSLKAKPMKGLTIDYTMGIDNFSQQGTTYIPPFAYNVNTAFWGGGASLDPTLNGYASAAVSNYFQINNELNATYQKELTKNIASTTQVGYSQQYERSTFSLVQGRGLAPFIETVNGASTILAGADQRGELSISGGYLQQNFRYKNQLFLTGAVRVDGSSVFAKEERNQTYFKVSGSYLLSETEYWKKLPISSWFDQLKLRAAYGQSGNLTGIGAYDRFNAYSSIAFVGRTSFTSSTILANTQMRPERQGELEIGTDMSFFNNRLGLTFNYYQKKVTDLLFDRVIAPSNGFSSRLDNFGSLENKGIELVLTGSPVRNKNFNWDVTFIYNQNRNKVLNLGSSLAQFSTNAGAPIALLPGEAVGVFYGTFFARDANGGQIKSTAGIPLTERGTQTTAASYTTSRDANGLPTGTVLRKIIGDPNPKFTGSFVNELSYKKLNLRAQVDFVQGVDVFNADWRTRQGVGNGEVAEQEHKGLLPRGYISGVYAIEEWRIDDGSFVKLRELSLGYNVGRIKGFGDLNLSLSGRNLISWDNYKGFDPEVNAAGQSTLLRGIDFGAVPIPRTFAFTVRAKF
ncbi:MAG: SusC/RagA family TonB-linked outer membrane protein [Chitinophagaceae bacterium]|uniref:SusC/RagA family TonB-linked outer membrane protein n=1 Tax=unclassified Paraflavitalea TaxID=2798305 RepID=UPI003D32643C|nr:SusC/RagA family TonB-linked outer membrane protein [Chitinophagaceae bacterium]